MSRAVKKLVLPPKPGRRVPVVDKQLTVVEPKLASDVRGLKAIEYKITLEDGTSLVASGEHANLIYDYLTECERTCAQAQLVHYLGPSLIRQSSEGVFMAQGPAARVGL